MNQDPEAIETEDAETPPKDSGQGEPSAEDEALLDGVAAAGEPKTAGVDSPPEEATEKVQAELEQVRDRHLRLAAEFDNYRKRMDNELTGAWSRAQADLVSRLLEGLDDLQRVGTWEASNTTVEALIEGVDLVERKLFQALQSAGLEGVDPTGERFDPNTMEAMMKVPAEDESSDNQVHQVFQKGYTFKGQLVRPARVSVLTHD